MDLFRENALRRLATPFETTQLVRLVRPAHLGVALGATLLLAAALVWSLVGRVNFTADAPGIFLRTGGLTEVVAPGPGQITSVLVDVGEFVEAGNPVALIAQPELALNVSQKQSELQEARRLHERTLAVEDAILERELAALTSERHGARSARARSKADAAWLERKQQDEQELLTRGWATEYQLNEVLTSQRSARVNVMIDGARLALNQARVLEAEWRHEQAVRASSLGLRKLERELELLDARHRRAVRVTAPVSGRVVELNTRVGAEVSHGSPVIRVERPDREAATLHAVLFFRPTEAKALSVGAVVRLRPAGVREREHGALMGRVSSISPHPGTKSAIRAILGNESLVEEYTATGSPFIVEVEPIPDAATASGYKWSTGAGPPSQIESGSVCTATVLTEQRTPISLLAPYVRNAILPDAQIDPDPDPPPQH